MKFANILLAILSLSVTAARGDTLRLTSGREIDCVILEETKEHFTIRRGYGVMNVDAGMVVKATRTPPVKAVAGPATKPTQPAITNGSAGRFPMWSSVVDAVTRQSWGKGLTQIPATYVDNGVQKDVPYQSYAVGDYEVNIYGDPDDPACIEIGIYRSLLSDAAAKQNCVELIASLLPNAVDASIARSLNRQKDLVQRYDFTIENTPPDAPDAYGGWWISIYDEGKLDRARASATEIEAVTIATPPTALAPKPASPAAPIAKAPTPKPPTAPLPPAAIAVTGDESDIDWTPAELQRRSTRASMSPASNVGGRVYARGYFRKNGTYVGPHTRRR